MSKLRVLHVLNELKPSGAEVMLRVAAPYWDRFGVSASLLTKGETEGPYAAPLREAGYPIHHLPFHPPLRFAVQWIRFLRRHSFDVVHLHTEHANFWLALLAKLAGVPALIRTVHNGFAFEGYLRRVRRLQRSLLRRLGVRHVSVGPTVHQSEHERFDNPTTVVQNWYDTEHFVPPTPAQRSAARESWDLAPSTFAIVTVGNCSNVKNHTALLEAIASLPSSESITYLHIGLSSDEAAEVQQAQALGLDTQVRFLGYVDDVRSALHAADAYVMPSLFEGFPISAIEAMGAGVPVLFTDVPGLRDLARLSDHIHWAEPSPSSLADGLADLLAMTPDARSALGTALHTDVRGRLHPERGVRRYTSLYHSCLAPSPKVNRRGHPAWRPTVSSHTHRQ